MSARRPDSTPTERDDVAAVLAEHEPLADYDGQIDQCRCGEWHGPDTWFEHAATHLAPLIAAREQAARTEACPYGAGDHGPLIRQAKTEALRGAARDLPGFDGIRTHGDAATWLRERADRIGGER